MTIELPQFAPVAPIHLLEQMFEHECAEGGVVLGGYHLLLAHDVMESDDKRKRFNSLMHDVLNNYRDDVTIIMDNSVVELGDAVEMSWVLEAAKHAQANVVVIPDAMSDREKTIEKFRGALDEMKSTVHEEYEFMFVPQGKCLQDFVWCVEEALRTHATAFSWIGLPRVARQAHGISRTDLVRITRSIVRAHNVTGMKYHLLGFSNDVIDDVMAAQEGLAKGIDSAVPVRAGQAGIAFKLSRSDYGGRGDYWTRDQSLTELARHNMAYFRKLIQS